MMAKAAAAHAAAGVKRSVVEVAEDKRALKESDVVQTFVLSSRVKTPSGNVFGQGFPVGYAVDGIESPEIVVTAGRTYKFTVLSACNHPFYLTTDSRGKGRAPLETGFDVPPAKSTPLICAGASILWKPTEDLIGKDIWYQCTIHDNMGWFVKVKKETFCEKYTAALVSPTGFKNSKGVLEAIVDGTIDAVLDEKSLLLEYFDGTVPAGSTNFTDPKNAAAANFLRDGLVNFFGAALGCSDGSIPAYTGRGMKEVHKDMPISGIEYDFFNTQLIKVVDNAGVDEVDQKFLLDLLNSPDVRGAICNFGEGCLKDSLCIKYAKALNLKQAVLMDKIVDAAFAPVIANAQQKVFFDGSVPAGSVNYFANAAALAELKKNFAYFLGRADVLACSDPDFPAARINIAGLKPLHAPMPITAALFSQFNDLVIQGVKTLGVSDPDLAAIRAVLDSTEPLICNQPGCSSFQNNIAKTFDLTVAPKVTGHHFFNQGFPAAFKIDGASVEGLTLEVGKTYAFKASQGCLHPFYFSNGTGGGSPDFENGILPADIGQLFCNGKVLTFTPQAADVGKSLFYVCKNHNFMGGRMCIVNAGQSSAACLLSGIPAPPASSACDELVDNVKKAFAGTADAANFNNANKTLTSVVLAVFTAGAGSVTAPLRKYFDGTKPAGSRNFFAADSAVTQGKLVFDLVKYFGARLGCSDNSIQPYASPADEPNMKTVHQFMNIDVVDFDTFNTVLVDEIQNFGALTNTVSQKTATTIRVFLNTTSTDICANCGNFQKVSICEKWTIAAKAKTQVELVQGAVLAVFGNLTAATSPAKDFFNGKVPCESRDFVVNKLNQAGLAKSLIAYFGQPGVLGCSDPNFPKYRGATDMEELHKEMPITKALFDQFLNALADYAKKNLAAVVPDLNDDLNVIIALFNSDGVAKICNQDGCPKKGKFEPKKCAGDDITTVVTTSGGVEETNGTTTEIATVPAEDGAASTVLAAIALVLAVVSML